MKNELLKRKGVEPQTAASFNRLGYAATASLRGCMMDRCRLSVYRCAVYDAQDGGRHDPEKCKWWNGKDKS